MKSTRKRFLIVALVVIAAAAVSFAVWYCVSHRPGAEQTNTGGHAAGYVMDIQAIDGKIYTLVRTETYPCELYRADDAQDRSDLLFTFPTYAVRYSPQRQCYYYFDGDALCSLDPLTGTSATLRTVASSEATITTLDELVYADAFEAGEATAQLCISTDALSLYDCRDGTLETLYTPASPSEVLVSACDWAQERYFVTSKQTLQTLREDGTAQTVDAAEAYRVIELLPADDALYFAAAENNSFVVLYRLTAEGVEELTRWDANYIVNGSCSLFLVNDTIYCSLATSAVLHEYHLS